MGRGSGQRLIRRGTGIALALLALSLLIGGGFLYGAQHRQATFQVEDELAAIAALKTEQISSWRHERLSDAGVLMSSPWLASGIAEWLAHPEDELRADITAHLATVAQRYHYADVLIVTPSGEVRLSLLGQRHCCAGLAPTLTAAMRAQQPLLTELHSTPVWPEPHLSAVAPVLVGEPGRKRAVGAVLLVVDARQFLYPLVQSWPTRSDTAETLLVRRDEDQALFLNDLRHRRGAALSLRLPLSRTDVPSVMAVLGQTGVVRGQDYRGVKVLAVLRAIPDSPWVMVSKVDDAEVFASFRVRSVLMLVVILMLFGLLALLGIIVLQRDRLEHAQAMRASEADSNRLREQLLQAQKLESIGRLAGGVAHDFNNMLAVILGRAEIALERLPEPHEARRDLEEIQTAAERSADLTKQLLAFARKQTVAPRILDLNDTVAGMLKMLRRLIGEDIELDWRPGPLLAKVEMDPTQLDQILANLAINARDALGGGGRIAIETKNACLDSETAQAEGSAVPGDYVMLRFSDNGCGMEKDIVEHVFEPFFTTKGLGHGTGLGLATVYGIVQQNRGIIQVESQPAQGTTFRIYLPACSTPKQQIASETNRAFHGSGELVLLVEDEEPLLLLGCAMLERLGYKVLSAATPDEALHLAKENAGKIELLLTDVVMPKMNGRQLAAALRENNPKLHCLYMSGYTADVIAHHGVLEDGVELLHKPFSMRELGLKVREVIGKPNSGA